MIVRKFAIADASFERSPGQDGEVFAGNVIDQRHGVPITIGFGRYGPNESIQETLAVDDVMVVLEGGCQSPPTPGRSPRGRATSYICPRARPSPSARMNRARSPPM